LGDRKKRALQPTKKKSFGEKREGLKKNTPSGGGRMLFSTRLEVRDRWGKGKGSKRISGWPDRGKKEKDARGRGFYQYTVYPQIAYGKKRDKRRERRGAT